MHTHIAFSSFGGEGVKRGGYYEAFSTPGASPAAQLCEGGLSVA